MYNDVYDEPAPFDSSDLYQMGLRAPRCNGCEVAKLKHELGDKFLLMPDGIYELDAEPREGQGEPYVWDGRSIRWHFWGMSYDHSDECYNWQPSKEKQCQSS